MQTFLIDYLHWIIYIYSQSISHLNKHILSQILSSSTALSTLNMQNIIMKETITFSKEYLLGPKFLQHKCFPNPKGEIQVAKYMQDKVIFYPHKEHTFQIKSLFSSCISKIHVDQKERSIDFTLKSLLLHAGYDSVWTNGKQFPTDKSNYTYMYSQICFRNYLYRKTTFKDGPPFGGFPLEMVSH